MGNYTTITIQKEGYTLAEVTGGRSLRATVNDHEDFVKGFVHTNGWYETTADDDYSDSEKSFDLTVVDSTVKINGLQQIIPVAFDWEQFNDDLLEGLRWRESLEDLPKIFKLEVLVPHFEGASKPEEFQWITYIVDGDSVKTESPFKGGTVIATGDFGSIVQNRYDYSTVEGQFAVGDVLDATGTLSSSAREEKRKELETAVSRAQSQLEYQQKELVRAQEALAEFEKQ